MKKIISSNPGRGYQFIGEVDISTSEEIANAVASATHAAQSWSRLGLSQRIQYLRSVFNECQERHADIKSLVVDEVGKTVKFVEQTFQRHMNDFEWFLDNVESAIADEITHEDENYIDKIVFEPLGVVAVIAPWNHPFGNFVWGIVPNLLVGNTVVLKHSEECPMCGKFLGEIVNSVGLPKGVFNQVCGDGEQGAELLNQKVDLVWFTGSSHVGQEVYRRGGEKFVKVIAEMGGSNPGVVFADADLDQCIPKLFAKRFGNCGQACDALKRLLIEEPIFEEVVSRLKAEIESKIFGYNDDPDTDIGSVAAKRQIELLQTQCDEAVAKGALVVTGGKKSENLHGAYFEPTLLTNISSDMRVWKEEVFGPLLIARSFKTEQEAIELANDTDYGLGSLVFTRDLERGNRVASQIKSGTVEINSASHWKTCNPFGGYKLSGMGREHGVVGFRELCELKVISSEK